MVIKVGYDLSKPLHEFMVQETSVSFPFEHTVEVFRSLYSNKIKVSFEL